MALEDRTLKLCNCNGTMALDGKALARALHLKQPVTVHTELCRRQSESFGRALEDESCVVGCTQEAALFTELADGAGSSTELRFVNLREQAAWSSEGDRAMPKIAALLALADLAEPEPVPVVSYKSEGRLLVIGPGASAVAWAERLAGHLDVSVLVTAGPGGELPGERGYPVWSGEVVSLKGYLGAFEVQWEQRNPIDLDLCTRCNACISACPENAIGFSYQIDLDKCRDHRACVKACGAVGAIDFGRRERARNERFDLILDLSQQPVLKVARPPQGYYAPGPDALGQAQAALELAQMTGEFEKPRFFAYNEKICAHSRSAKRGCTQCIDVCSTGAISPHGDHIKVEPHLCLGCGGCATVCPSGALTYAYPRVPDTGLRLKRLLSSYAAAGGASACLLLHDTGEGKALLGRLGRAAGAAPRAARRGLPARVIPFEVHHPASAGMDLLLAAIAYGASQVVLLATAAQAAEYGEAIGRQIGFAEQMLDGLGYAGRHFHLLATEDPAVAERALWDLQPAMAVARPATFNLSAEKRATLEFALEHLYRHAPAPREELPLGSGAPYGAVRVDRDACTLCMACAGACPESALVDGRDLPMLKFIERNCVQCGLCVNTCPENALSLQPRLLLAPSAKQEVVLNEAEPFHCVRCGKPFGTRRMIDGMLGKLAGHSMFAGGTGLARLQMCSDCRVVDMMENPGEVSILDLRKD